MKSGNGEKEVRDLVATEHNQIAPDILVTCSDKRVFGTRREYFGLALNCIQVGDIVSLVYGARVPFVIRPSSNVGPESGFQLHHLVCEAYIHGIMNGETLKLGGDNAQTLIFG